MARKLGREISSQYLKGSHKVSVGRAVPRTTELIFLGVTDSETRSNKDFLSVYLFIYIFIYLYLCMFLTYKCIVSSIFLHFRIVDYPF